MSTETDEIDEWAKQLGFVDKAEMFTLISGADLSTPEKYRAFIQWKENDGTKAGALKLQKPV